MERLLADARYALRMLLKRPVFTFVAVITLALGIGANTAIFSVINAVLLAPLPYDKPDELTIIYSRHAPSNSEQQPSSLPDVEDWRAQSESFEQIAAARTIGFNLNDGDEPVQVTGARVSANLFSLLRVQPVLGREFVERETQPGGEPVALLSYSLWQQRYGGDASLVGRALRIDGRSYTIVGVLPQGFYFPTPETLIYVPFIPTKSELIRGNRFVRVIGRRKATVPLAEAQVEMETIASRIAEQYRDTNADVSIQLMPLHEQIVGQVRPALLVLLGAVGCVLLIACANVANLLLARAAARRNEFAIRTALGASRTRLVRQLLTESVLLSMVGGTLGLLLAMWGVPMLTGISASSIPRVEGVRLDGKVLAFTLLVSFVTGIIFGFAPALQSSSKRLTESLKEGRKGATGGVLHQRLLNLLVITEVAVAVVLLVAAGLMIRSFVSISNVAPGFNPQGVVTMGISLSQPGYADIQEQARFYERLLAKVRALPGVQSAAGINRLPLFGFNASTNFTIQGKPVQSGMEPVADFRIISPDCFKTMGIPLLAGHDFTERDTKDTSYAAVINQAMAERFFAGEDPIGKRLQVYPDPMLWREIVGVVGNVKLKGLDADINPAIYVPLPQNPYPNAMRGGFLAVRTEADTRSIVAAVRNELKTVDSGVPIAQVRTMEEIVAGSLAQRRLSMSLLVVFAALAALLAAVGIYGVMAYSVTERTHEIGLRMALGASSADVLRLVMGNGARLVAAGLAVGLGAAVALTRVMASLLFQVSATDPATYVSIAALLAAIALLASYLPARKAARVDPMVALRYD
jgi:putative ABC transport system permease protein